MTQDSSVSPEPTNAAIIAEAKARAEKDKRPVEFATMAELQAITSRHQETYDAGPKLLWAWPDGTITRPESLRQRMRNLKFKRAKHGEEMP